jgi:hypothetical protein
MSAKWRVNAEQGEAFIELKSGNNILRIPADEVRQMAKDVNTMERKLDMNRNRSNALSM